MKNTVKDMLMHYTTTADLEKAFTTLWRSAKLHGFTMEFEDEVFMISHLDWYIEYDENKNGVVTFYDEADGEIEFKRTGRSGSHLKVVKWNLDRMAFFRNFKFEE